MPRVQGDPSGKESLLDIYQQVVVADNLLEAHPSNRYKVTQVGH
jgi:hypothetical protein